MAASPSRAMAWFAIRRILNDVGRPAERGPALAPASACPYVSPRVEIFAGHRALFRPLAAPAVALGNFDGVHEGHARLLSAARAAADRLGGDAVVYTFEPHPARVLAPELAPPLITTTDRKLELLSGAGIDVCVLEPFDRALAEITPEDFARQVLLEVLGARQVVVGYDFTYGHQRRGNVATLREFGARHGVTVEVIDPVTVDGLVVSSSKVRELVAEGDLARARLLLGRDFDVDGRVVRGAGRGRDLGFPTANLALEAELLPAPGIYATRVRVLDDPAGAWLEGAASLGTNPTFGEGAPLVLEVHLLDFGGDLYDRRLRVAFVERLRAEQRFESAGALVAEIRRDVERTREVLRRGG
jgi:riboflavin kinase / FMN adenylyltransferase